MPGRAISPDCYHQAGPGLRDKTGRAFGHCGRTGAAVSVRLVPGTEFLEINAIHGQPAVAAEYANVVAEDFVRYVAGVRGSQLISARAELPKQLAKRGELISSQKVAD